MVSQDGNEDGWVSPSGSPRTAELAGLEPNVSYTIVAKQADNGDAPSDRMINGSQILSLIHISREAYIGELDVAAYCGCQYCIGRSDTYVTWSGRLPTQGTTVAADLNGFESGDVLRIGSDIYRVEDKVSPGAREALCLYFSNHADAIAFGRQILPVFKIKSREEHLGEPLGIFEVTGYCGCEKCCGLKGGLTKAEKIPKAGHTLSLIHI